MNNIGISYIDYYVPSTTISIENFCTFIDETSLPATFKNKDNYQRFLKDTLNLKEIVVENDLSEGEMLANLLQDFFLNVDVKSDEIDVLIISQEIKTGQQKNISQYLIDKFKMKNAYVLNTYGNHCANVESTLKFLNDIYGSGKKQNILLLTSTKTHSYNERIIGSYAVLGDAAGLLFLNNEPKLLQFEDVASITNGALHDVDKNQDLSLLHCKYYTKSLKEILLANFLEPKDIETVIIQNANPLLIQQVLDALEFDKEQVLNDNIGRYGHLENIDFIMNLKCFLDDRKKAIRNNYVLAFGTGISGTYISTLMRCV